MHKTLLLLSLSSFLNAVFGTVWKRSMAVTHYTTLLTLAGLSVGLFGIVMMLRNGKPLVPDGNYAKLWPLAATIVLVPLFYSAVSMLVQRMPFSRVYPMVSVGTMIFAVLIDYGTGVDPISIRKFTGIALAVLAIWCIRG